MSRYEDGDGGLVLSTGGEQSPSVPDPVRDSRWAGRMEGLTNRNKCRLKVYPEKPTLLCQIYSKRRVDVRPTGKTSNGRGLGPFTNFTLNVNSTKENFQFGN